MVLDVPLGHKDAAFVRSSLMAWKSGSTTLTADEIMVAVAVTRAASPSWGLDQKPDQRSCGRTALVAG